MKECQIVNADKEVDYRNAERILVLYFKEQDMHISHCQEWTKWTYGSMPFWSVWGLVYGHKKASINFCGIHIYDDGRVVIVSSVDNDANEVIENVR